MSDVDGAEDSSSEESTTEPGRPRALANAADHPPAQVRALPRLMQVPPEQVAAAFDKVLYRLERYQERRAERQQLQANRERLAAVAYVAAQEEVGRVAGREYVAPRGEAALGEEMRQPDQQTIRGAAHQIAGGNLPTQMPVINRVPPGGVGGVGHQGVLAAANAAEEWLRHDGGLRAAANAAEDWLRHGNAPPRFPAPTRPLPPLPPKK